MPFGDASASRGGHRPNTCAFLVEPIQGEAGIVIPPAGYLKQAAEICRRNRVLLMADEIQSGLGRTGELFAYMHEGTSRTSSLSARRWPAVFIPFPRYWRPVKFSKSSIPAITAARLAAIHSLARWLAPR